MLCRTTADCSWLDRNLFCLKYNVVLNSADKAAWFGGAGATITGKCQCEDGMEWDDDDLECQASVGVGMIVLYCLIGLIGFVVVTCAACYCIGKRL